MSVFPVICDEQIVELFDPKSSGVLYIRNAIDACALKDISTQIAAHSHLYSQAPRTAGRATQNYKSIVLKGHDFPTSNYLGEEPIDFNSFLEIRDLSKAYTRAIYNPIATHLGSSIIDCVNNCSIHEYPAANGHISWHRDLACWGNVVGVLSVSGESEFLYGDESKPYSNIAKAGDLVLLRAYTDGIKVGEEIRPPHAAYTRGNTPRTSIGFRQVFEVKK